MALRWPVLGGPGLLLIYTFFVQYLHGMAIGFRNSYRIEEAIIRLDPAFISGFPLSFDSFIDQIKRPIALYCCRMISSKKVQFTLTALSRIRVLTLSINSSRRLQVREKPDHLGVSVRLSI